MIRSLTSPRAVDPQWSFYNGRQTLHSLLLLWDVQGCHADGDTGPAPGLRVPWKQCAVSARLGALRTLACFRRHDLVLDWSSGEMACKTRPVAVLSWFFHVGGPLACEDAGRGLPCSGRLLHPHTWHRPGRPCREEVAEGTHRFPPLEDRVSLLCRT